ncbi:MAG: ester cyclase [Rhizobiaceae bacterium]
MKELQAAKHVVRKFHAVLDNANTARIPASLKDNCRRNFLWRGVHPFGEILEPEQVAEEFWIPLRNAFCHLQRRDDIFFAGVNQMDNGNSIWVASMGHLMGLFDETFLGIRPSQKIAMLRYCAFHRVEGDKITETCMHLDIPHLMMQAGQSPFAPQTGAHLVQPGPRTHDGLLYEAQPENSSAQTLSLINSMISNLGLWQSGLPLDEELAQDWRDDMLWWGPAGIGSTYTIERYARQHAGPFRAGFVNRTATNHICRTAEGHYGGFFGWPNFTAEPSGGFMGMPATGKAGEFRVIDIYRREGDKLAENWVFIDLLHFWNQQGVDILARNLNSINPA